MSEFGGENPVREATTPISGEKVKGERFKRTIDTAVAATLAVINVVPDRFGLPENVWRHALDIAIKPVQHAARDLQEKDKPPYIDRIESNPHLRSFTEIIAEGIDLYRQTHGKDPTYTVKPDRVGVHDFLRMMGQKMTQEDENEFCKPGGHSNFKKIPMAGRSLIASMMSGVMAGLSYTGIKEMMEMKLPPRFMQIITNAEDDEGDPLGVSKQTNDQFFGARAALDVDIENEVKNTGEPVSVSFLLSKLLLKHDGNLNLSLLNLSEYLKYKAGRIKYSNSTDEIWFKEHIRDEYSDFAPYHTLNQVEYEQKDERMYTRSRRALLAISKVVGNRYAPIAKNFEYSLLNQIGKPYHAAYMVALLEFFPPEMIGMMTSMEYLLHGVNHGMSKFLADLRVLRDLKKIEKMLGQYSTTQPRTDG